MEYKRINIYIRMAWVTLLIFVIVAGLMKFLAKGTEKEVSEFIFYGGLILALAYGVKRKSRVCCLILLGLFSLVFFVMARAVLAGDSAVQGLTVALIGLWITYVMIMATIASFKYHQLVKVAKDYEVPDGDIEIIEEEKVDRANSKRE